MNRNQRRAAMRRAGLTWKQGRAAALRKAEQVKTEAAYAALASKLTPAQAREALARWAAQGGDHGKVTSTAGGIPAGESADAGSSVRAFEG